MADKKKTGAKADPVNRRDERSPDRDPDSPTTPSGAARITGDKVYGHPPQEWAEPTGEPLHSDIEPSRGDVEDSEREEEGTLAESGRSEPHGKHPETRRVGIPEPGTDRTPRDR